jgi:energy-coupling factor transporter ATP-binding protein EcfA2
MKITRLSVANLRSFKQEDFDFHPEFTLLVGVNGAGKTTVLKALRIGLSRLLPKVTVSKARPDSFHSDDIRVGADSMTIDLAATVGGANFNLVILKQREQNVADKSGVVRQQTFATPDKETLTPTPSKAATMLRKLQDCQPFGLYFSTRRSLPSDEEPKFGQARGGQAVAFVDALAARPLRLGYLAKWMRVQEHYAEEFPSAPKHVHSFREAARLLMPDCENLRVEKDENDRARLFVTKKGVPLDIRQLSDGERSTLALALDLAQRLSQANPGLDNPIRDGKAVVLIDEIDMHLHPLWQRQIVSLLTNTFPNCQFIATTHSPQIIGETQPEQIILLQAEEERIVSRRCGQAYGLDTNAILEQIMGTASRAEPARRVIASIEAALDDGELNLARERLSELRILMRGDDSTVAGLEATINNLEALGDAANN